jgi:hypothetical protein
MSESNTPHLSQQELAEIEGIDGIILALGGFLEGAKFEEGKKANTQNCADDGLPAATEPLLIALGFKKVASLDLKFR